MRGRVARRLVHLPRAEVRLDLDAGQEVARRLHDLGDAVVASAASLAELLERRGRHAALAGDLEAALEGLVGVGGRLRHVLVVRVHPELAAGRLHDRRGLAVVVGVGVRADDQPDVLEPQAGLAERELELAHRARLVDAGVDEHDAVAGRDRVGVPVRHARPGQRQAQPPQPGQHPVGAGQLSPPCGHGGNLVSRRADQHAGVEDPGRVDRVLGRPQRRGERLGALAVVPGPVVAADGVVVGDRPARGDDRLRGGRLDLVPLLELVAAPGRGEHGEVGRRAVRIGVREPAGDPCPRRAPRAVRSRTSSTKAVEAVPGDRGLEGLGEDAAGDQRVAQVGHLQEGVAPGVGRAVAAARARLVRELAAVVAAELGGAGHPGVERVVGRLEAEHEQRPALRRRAGERGLARVEQAAVGGVQPGLGERPHRLGARARTSRRSRWPRP